MPTIREQGNHLIEIDSDGVDDANAFFEVLHDVNNAPLLRVQATGVVTVYGPITGPGTQARVSTTSGSRIVDFVNTTGATVASVSSDGAAVFEGGVKLPVSSTLPASNPRLLTVVNGIVGAAPNQQAFLWLAVDQLAIGLTEVP